MKKTTKAQIPSVSKGGEDSSRTDEEDQDYVPSESAFGLDSAAETERSGETNKMSEEHDAPGGDDIEGEGTGGDTEEEEEEVDNATVWQNAYVHVQLFFVKNLSSLTFFLWSISALSLFLQTNVSVYAPGYNGTRTISKKN